MILQFPVSALLACIFFIATYLIFKGKPIFAKKASDRKITLGCLLVVAVMIAIEGTWPLKIHKEAVFVFFCLILIFQGTVVFLNSLKTGKISFTLSHLGFVIIIAGALFGVEDTREGHMDLVKGQPEYLAAAPDGSVVPLPYNISLKDFKIDFYEDGISPKQYTSTILIDGTEYQTSVNHPLFHKGWMIYQSGFDASDHNKSTLLCVRDPWVWIVFFGMAVLALGAILSFSTTWNSRWMLVVAVLLAAVFGAISLARVNFGTLVPALRSLWFVPHLIIYMIAYSLMALSLIFGIVSFFSKKNKPFRLSGQFLSSASSLLILGMLCGAVWAKFAWGNYWTWDAKECWAATTWMLTLCLTHFLYGRDDDLSFSKKKLAILIILVSFLAMQITWYGVNWLPSSQGSLHTYTQE